MSIIYNRYIDIDITCTFIYHREHYIFIDSYVIYVYIYICGYVHILTKRLSVIHYYSIVLKLFF